MSANTLVATLLAMSGQRSIITVPRAFVRFTKSFEAGMMLNQLLYWTPRKHGDAIYKTDLDWADELCLTRYAVRKARECLEAMGFLTVEVHHVRGAPAVHYTIDYDVLVDRWTSWLQGQEVKSENELYNPPSKVRKRTLPDESSAKTNLVKFENGQTINRSHRLHAEIGDGDGRTLAFLIDMGIGAAEEFAHLPFDQTKQDYYNRKADNNQSNAMIVKAWRIKPPTESYHYEQPIRPDRPDRSAAPDNTRGHAHRPSRPRGSHNPSGGAELRDPGWMDREIAAAEARARQEL